jgi:dihydrofolate synthase / folylpolyglutamate synthase
MAVSDTILKRLLELHPKVIDLELDRMWRLLELLDHPEEKLPPVIHVAGTNGKGSVVAYLRAIMEAAGLSVHVYTSPHLVRFHERIRIGHPDGGELIEEASLSALLQECEVANGAEPITFFEITTAAALLAFARAPADYLLLEVGLGGRLDATNVVARPALSIITTVDYDHQFYLGDTLSAIAGEKAGILKANVRSVIGPQSSEGLAAIERIAAERQSRLAISGQDWQAFEQHGALVYQDETGLLDLPLPHLPGRFQIDNAGTAVAAIRALGDPRIGLDHISAGLVSPHWPARLQRLGPGVLYELVPDDVEIWLDGGHNPAAGRAVAQSMADLNDRVPRPLILITGMLKTKEAAGFIRPFAGLAAALIAVDIPGEENSLQAGLLKLIAESEDLPAETAASIEDAVARAGAMPGPVRILICGSLYLAGRVLAAHCDRMVSDISGAG